MNTSRKTIAIYWHANMRHPGLFLGAALFWIVGMGLHALAVPFMVAQAVNRLVAVFQSHPQEYWPIFMPYIVTLAGCGLVGQMCIEAAFILLSRLEVKTRPALQNKTAFLTF